MQIYYHSLQAIEQQTMQLDSERCVHCHQAQQLVSHGFIRKKRQCAEPEAVGKRVFCSNRHPHTGCGRTMQLCLDTPVRYLHYAGSVVMAFVVAMMMGMSIAHAYEHATGTPTPRNAYRWLNRLCAQLSTYRSVVHHPPLQETTALTTGRRSAQLQCLMSAMQMLLLLFEEPLCANYQSRLQRPFL